jgi:nucleotide-binding universal stress UspA family protein
MKFMVCYDGSAESKEALKLAQQQAKALGARLEIVKTISRDSALKRSFIEESEKELNREIAEIMGESEVPFSAQLLIGSLSAGEQIVKFARDEEINQIFVGIEKTSKVDKLVFGSTAQYVILQAPCPVVTVKGVSGKKRR